MKEEYKFKHSKLKIIGSILFVFGVVSCGINGIVTRDIDIGISLLMFGVLGGVLILVGLFNEM